MVVGSPHRARQARHARQRVLPEVGDAGQAALAAARVLVVGCGGLGAPVIQQLAAAGVGHLTLADDDVVEISNLNRQTLFGVDDVGQRKAERAAARVRFLDPDIDVTALVERLALPRAHALVAQHDLVVDATDGLPSKYLLNDVAVAANVPLVHGAATAWAGQVLLVPGRAGPCLRCLFPEIPPRASVPTCRSAGILAPVTGVVGSLQAALALQWLLGIKGGAGTFVAVDVKGLRTQNLTLSRDPTCPACGDHPTVASLRNDDYVLDDS